MKAAGCGYGELPPKDAEETPFDTVCVDLIGPWKLSIFEEQKTIELNALSIIDAVTGLTEFSRINSKEAAYIATEFTRSWLQRYPKPRRCIHDNGSEFIGAPFQQMLSSNGIQDVPTTTMSNGICERSHQTIANHLRTIINDKEIPTIDDAERILHQTLKTTPGALVFNRDMLLPIPFHHNFEAIHQRRQQLIDNNNARQNFRRLPTK
jgi:transposase InsO family protein